eukprot:403333917
MNQPKNYDKPGSFLPKVSRDRYKEKVPVIHSRSVNYRQDGSGRDSYIMHGNGGYSNSNKPQEFREAFKNSLRSYERNDSYIQSRKSSIIKKAEMHQSLMNIKSRIENNLNDSMNQDYQQPTRNNEQNNQTIQMPQYSQTIQNSPKQYIPEPQLSSTILLNQDSNPLQTQNQKSTKDIMKIGSSYLKNQQLLYKSTFNQSRNSQQAAALLISDNPKLYQIRALAGYQKNLNERLSQPKFQPGEGEGSLTRSTFQNTTFNNSPERMTQKTIMNQSRTSNNLLNLSSANKTQSSAMFKSNGMKKRTIQLKKFSIDQEEILRNAGGMGSSYQKSFLDKIQTVPQHQSIQSLEDSIIDYQ